MIGFKQKRRSWSHAVLAVALLGACQGLAYAKLVEPGDPARFTATVAERFRRAAPKLTVRITAPLRLDVSGAASGGHDIYLDRIYAACASDPQGCDALVGDYVGKLAAFDQAPPPPLDRGTLRVIVRQSDYVEQMRKAGAASGGPVAMPLAGDFWMVLASDQPTTIRVVSVHDLKALGLSAKAAVEIAKANMASDMQVQIKAARKGPRRAVKVMAAGAYESSLLAFPELWTPSRAGSTFLVAIPASDVMLYCGDASAEAVKALAETARAVMAHDDRPLSDAVFQWTPQGWKPMAAP